MNKHMRNVKYTASIECFRPQQGLTIMNKQKKEKQNERITKFPSPTGVNYYELLNEGIAKEHYTLVSVPNRG